MSVAIRSHVSRARVRSQAIACSATTPDDSYDGGTRDDIRGQRQGGHVGADSRSVQSQSVGDSQLFGEFAKSASFSVGL